MFTLDPGATQAGMLHAFNSDAAISLHDAITSTSEAADLDQLTQRLWRDHVAGSISEIDAEFLDRCIQRQAPSASRIGSTCPGLPAALAARLTPRRRVKRPDAAREAARRRKRMLAGSSALPPELRSDYSEAERAVLCIVAGEVKRTGLLRLPDRQDRRVGGRLPHHRANGDACKAGD